MSPSSAVGSLVLRPRGPSPPSSASWCLEAESGLGYHSTGRSAAILTESYEAGPIRELTGRSRTILTTEFASVPGLLTRRGLLVGGRDRARRRGRARTRRGARIAWQRSTFSIPGTAQALVSGAAPGALLCRAA